MQLNNDYQREDFITFLEKDLLTDFKRDIRPVNVGDLSSLKNASYLGESKSLDLQVFEFLFEGSPNKRIALTKDAFLVMRSSAIFKALAIFYSSDKKDWRFSLMTATPGSTEKGKVVTSYSNPKRLSFFLGANAKINTPTKFLISKGKIKDFEDLQSRFSIEVVNKEFYKEISQAFTKLVNGLLKLPSLQDKSQVNLEFAVRLIGRIIFCWFLREKKSKAGLPLMPKELLSLDAVNKNSDYYHKILEPIFFEILNKQADARITDFSKEPFLFVPYLNGGLFSPQTDDYYIRTNDDLQSQFHNTLEIPNNWFKEFFEILETYNFTIDENTSYDEELSIDPEMLGRIFENLLAEINPETGESARKSTGSYYTPRIIVNYMVDESLLLYLKEQTKINEEKLRALISYDLSDDSENPITAEEKEKIVDALDTVKILDPACGSGAFPIGALQKIVFILQQTDPDGKLWFKKQTATVNPEFRRDIEKKFSNNELDFIRKLGVIRNSIYGVDIQPIATEISRLRCFLTLIVDEAINDSEKNRGIKPLPNLDFKFVTANSLIGLPSSDSSSSKAQQTEMFDDKSKIEDLKAIRERYFTASGLEREQLKTEFINAQEQLISELDSEHGFMSLFKAELTRKLYSWKPFMHKSAPWFDPEWMFGIKDGFDIVIANPPYVEEKGHKEMFREIKNSPLGKKFYLGKMNLFYFFFHMGLDNLHNSGLLAFITTNYYPTSSGAHKLREDFKNRTIIKKLIDFNGLKIFKSATGQHNMISILIKSQDSKAVAKTCITKHTGEASPLILGSIINWQDKITDYFEVRQKDIYDGDEYYIRLAGTTTISEDPTQKILFKIKQQGELLSNFYKINQGLKTNADSLSRQHREKFKVNKSKGSGIFILNNTELKNLNPHETENRFIKPFYKNSDIKKYFTSQKSTRCVLYITNNNYLTPDDKSLKLHLDAFIEILKGRAEVEPNGRIRIYAITRPRAQKMFEREKIVCPLWSRTNVFGFNISQWYSATDVTFVTKLPSTFLSAKYGLALLNAKLFYFWLYHKGKRKGELLELSPKPLSEIPIKKISGSEQKPFIEIVDKILAITNNEDYLKNPKEQAQVKEYEKQIDQLVYKLYDLTPEEISIVEGIIL